jgi:hypothetical protein
MNSQKPKHWYQLEQGDLLRNKHDGALVIVLSMFTKFFQDANAYHYDVDYGVADTALRVQWVQSGKEHIFRMGRMKFNWEIVCR